MFPGQAIHRQKVEQRELFLEKLFTFQEFTNTQMTFRICTSLFNSSNTGELQADLSNR